MGEYERFIQIVQKNLARKRCSKKKKAEILAKIEDRYRESSLFTPVEQMVEDAENIRHLLNARTNCFGPSGFPVVDVVPREQRVPLLRDCYEDFPPFPKRDTIKTINERGQFGRTALHEAVASSDRKSVSLLLSNGADAYVTDNNGHTPYMLAKFNGQKDMMRYLRDLGIKK